MSSKRQGGIPCVWLVGGHDPCNGAGAGQDAAVIRACGAWPCTLFTALTIQNSSGLSHVHEVAPLGWLPVQAALVEAQWEWLVRDMPPDALSIGMLGTAEMAGAVARCLLNLPKPVPVVLDPVLGSGSGTPLYLEEPPYPKLFSLMVLATVVTPNLPEFERLSGKRGKGNLVKRLQEFSDGIGTPVLLKGGHSQGAPVDLLQMEGETFRYEGKRIKGPEVHGTGGALAAAVALALAEGRPLPEAVSFARRQVRRWIRSAITPGNGQRMITP